MQVTVETTSGLERRMVVQVPAEKVDTEVNKRVRDTAKRVRLDGFRPGKVPMSVVRQRFGQSIRSEVLQEVVKDAYVEALQQEDITPAGYPRFENVEDEGGGDVEFAAVFEVFPQIGLGDFASVETTRQQSEVTDENVDQMIESLREQRAEYRSVERGSQNRDKVKIDFVGRIDGEEFEGGRGEGQELVLGSGQMVPGFEDRLVGAEPGKETVLAITFPEDYDNADLAGKPAEFSVAVHEVLEPELPEVDEDFMQALGATGASLDAFREEVRRNMEREARQATQRRIKNDVINQLIALSEFDAPTALIDEEVQRLRQEAVQQFGGGDDFDPNQLPRELFADQAERRVRTGLIFSEIARRYEIEADEAAVRTRVEELASVYQDPDSVVQYYLNNQEQLSQVQSLVVEDGVVDRVLEDAAVTDVTVDYYEAVKRDN